MRFYPFITICWLLFSIRVIAQPSITSFSPTAGPVGSIFTITGNNFDPLPANNKVFMSGVQATVAGATATSLSVVVPAGASTQGFYVTVNRLTAFSYKPFHVTFPGGYGGFDTSSFAGPQHFPTPKYPYGITMCDLDNDGKPDVIGAIDAVPSVFYIMPNLSTPGNVVLGNRIDYTTTANLPYKIATGDFNGDGKPDVVVACYYNPSPIPGGVSNLLSVFKNISTPGNISLATELAIPVLNFPRSATVADFDNDGKPDIAISGSGVSILRNTSVGDSISFASPVELAGVYIKEEILAGDLDGDGKPDLAGATTTGGGFARNISTPGNIAFSAFTALSGGSSNLSAALADFDEDGKPDLIIASRTAIRYDVNIFKNSSSGPGNISFEPKRYVYNNAYAMGVAVNDFDGDGLTDIAITNDYPFDNFHLIKNISSPGNMQFQDRVTFSFTGSFGLCTSGDIDIDGKPDIVTSNYHITPSSFIVLRNKSNQPKINSFSPDRGSTGDAIRIRGKNLSVVNNVSFGGVACASFVIDGDTAITAILGPGTSGSVLVSSTWGNHSMPGFTFNIPIVESFDLAAGNTGASISIYGKNFLNATYVKFGNVDAASFVIDSASSITAVVGNGASGSVTVGGPLGSGTLPGFTFVSQFPVITSFSPVGGMAGTTITIKGKKFSNAMSVSFGGSPASSFTVLNDSTITAIVGAGSTGKILIVTPSGSTSIRQFTYMTGPPIVTGRERGIPLSKIKITGKNFSQRPSDNIVYFGEVKATVLSSNDTTLYLIVPPGASNVKPMTVTVGGLTCYWYPFSINLSTGLGGLDKWNGRNFTPPIQAGTGQKPTGICAGDFDLDGKADIAVCNSANATGGNSISILKNTTNNFVVSFAPKVDFACGTEPKAISTGDFDGDGKLDIAVANYISNTISLLRNTSTPGNVSFAPKIDLATGSGPESMIVYDFNKDGKPDIAVVNYLSNTLDIFQNASQGSLTFARISYTTGSNPHNLFLNDANYDGMQDLFLLDGRINIFLNTGTMLQASFVSSPSSFNEFSPSAKAVFEHYNSGVGEDTGLDVFMANKNTGNNSLYTQQGRYPPLRFEWSTPITHPYNYRVTCMAVSSIVDGSYMNEVVMGTQNGMLSIWAMNPDDSGSDSVYVYDKQDIICPGIAGGVLTADFDGDGSQDICVSSENLNSVSVFQNISHQRISECVGSLYSFYAATRGSTYKWEIDRNNGFGFVPISGSGSPMPSRPYELYFYSLHDSLWGFKYRCVVDGVPGPASKVVFINFWNGDGQTSAWEDAGNWSCGSVPGQHTDVFIKSGNVIISTNVTCNSLKVSPNANVTVAPGGSLTILDR